MSGLGVIENRATEVSRISGHSRELRKTAREREERITIQMGGPGREEEKT